MADTNDMGVALGWDDEIEVTENEFEPVPDGDYDFEVVSVERSYFNGSAKMAPCPVAKVQVRLLDDGRGAHLFERFMLSSKVSWKISDFFKCVGMRRADAGKEEKLKMDWMGAIGRRGRLTVGSREYNGKTYNEVTKWHKPAQPAQAAPAAYQPPQSVPAPAPAQRMVNQELASAQAAPQMTPGAF